MARILLGWELGANRGHVVRLLHIADRMSEDGHEVALALQNISFLPTDRLGAFTLFQAPLWPRLLTNNTALPGRPATSMGDILHRVGLDNPASLPSLVAGWLAIFGAFRPELVVADFAPVLGLAARGRIPSIAVGTGFSCPPSELEFFPSLTDEEPVYSESVTLACANDGLAAIGEPEISNLPEIFGADRCLVGEFAMLDPYDGFRLQPLRSPSVADPQPQIAPQGGDEIFVYAFERAMNFTPLWEGLQRSGLPVRVYIPGISEHMAGALRARGVMVEQRPQSFGEIGRRSRFVLSHGGHGFVCSALLAGLPQVVTHYDLEKRFMGDAVARHGLGGYVALQDIKAEPFAASLRQLYEASAVQLAVRKAAEKLHEEMGQGCSADVIEAVEELIG